jgi:putative alpha-1,2-mannosidase
MKKIGVLSWSLLVTSCALWAQQQSKSKQAIDYVNPLIGTPYAGFKKGLDGGGTVPAVGTPFAMTNFLAQTAEPKMGLNAYVYEEKSIMGFLASHQPTVWMGDYGYVSVMPQIGELILLPKDRALPFEHSDEVSHPYYYSVLLNAGNNQKIKGEIAAASRTGIFQFTFPASDQARFIIQGIDLNPELPTITARG